MTTKYTSSAAAAFIKLRGFLTLGILGAAALFFAFYSSAPSADFYARALRDHAVFAHVVVDGTRYAVVNGAIQPGEDLSADARSRILRLAYAKALAERSPFMALAGTDPAKLRSAIAALADTQQRLARMQKTPRDSALVLSGLYPISFLTALAETEAARVRFIASGDERDGRAYRLAEERAFAAYQEDIARFRSAFRAAVPDSAPQYNAAGDVISKPGIEHALDELAHGARTLHISFEDRERCLEGNPNRCAAADLSFSIPAAPDMRTASAAALAQASDIRSLLAQGTGHPEITKEPIVQLSQSICAPPIHADPLFLTYDSGALPTGEVFQRPLFLGDIMLIDSAAQAQLPFFRYFAEHGIGYVFTSPLSYYKCMLNGYDMGKILSIQNVIDYASSTPASASAQGAEAQTLQVLEQRLTDRSGVVTEKAAAEYVRQAQAALSSEGNDGALASLALELRNGSTRFDNMLAEIVGTENTNGNLTEESISIPLDAPYLFYVRNGFASLFLAWNPSATGPHESLFPPNTAPFDRQPFILYSALPKTPAVRDALIRDLQFYFDVHHNAKDVSLSGAGL